MPDAADSESGVITPSEPAAPAQDASGIDAPAQDGVITPSERAQEQAQTPELGELGQEDHGDWADEELLNILGANQEQQDGVHEAWADHTEQPEDFDGLDWLAEDEAPQFGSQQEFDAYLQEKSAEVVHSWAFDQEMSTRAAQLGQLEEKYPDIHDYVDPIRSDLEARADQYGLDPQLVVTDPALVEAVYQGLKAEDEATPTEQDPSEALTLAAKFPEMARPAAEKDAFE